MPNYTEEGSSLLCVLVRKNGWQMKLGANLPAAHKHNASLAVTLVSCHVLVTYKLPEVFVYIEYLLIS
jgi:hypothetical protein